MNTGEEIDTLRKRCTKLEEQAKDSEVKFDAIKRLLQSLFRKTDSFPKIFVNTPKKKLVKSVDVFFAGEDGEMMWLRFHYIDGTYESTGYFKPT